MLDASNAVENQKVSICRLSSERKDVIVMALSVALTAARQWEARDERNRNDIIEELEPLKERIKASKEIWLIES